MIKKRFIFFLFICLMEVTPLWATPIGFQEGSFISDTQTEDLLNRWLKEMFDAVGLKNYQPKIHIMVSPVMNAAATTGGDIMITTGLLVKAKSGLQVYGVLCHEVGHIKKGHVSQFDHHQRSAMGPALVAVILGGLASAAAGSVEGLAAGAAAGQDMFARSLMKGMQGFELEADFLGLDILKRKNYSAKGLVDFFTSKDSKIAKIFKSDYPAYNTHPMSEARLSNFNQHLNQYDARTIPFPDEAAFKNLQEKYQGYFGEQMGMNNHSMTTPVMQAASAYRAGHYTKALQLINQILTSEPNNPYWLELKSQIQAESGQLELAIQTLSQIPEGQRNRNVTIQQIHYMLENGQNIHIDQTIQKLKSFISQKEDDLTVWYLLAKAYAIKAQKEGNNIWLQWADYATAKLLYCKGDLELALQKANNVRKITMDAQLKVRCQDIINQINHIKHP